MHNRTVRWISIPDMVKAYFTDTSGEKVNLFIVGAGDGEIQDFMTQYVMAPGVKAVLVEPVKDSCRKLRRKFADYPNVVIENVAIYKINGKRKMYKLMEDPDLPPWSVGLGSFNKDIILSHSDQIPDVAKRIISESVNCITMDELLKKHAFEMDILQIDTEGFDFEIIRSIDFHRIRPDMIIFEILHLTFHQFYALVDFFGRNNYNLFRNADSLDLLAIDREIA